MMSNEVSILSARPAPNAATSPQLSQALINSVSVKSAQVVALLTAAVKELSPITFANSFGAEDMVLTDIILKNKLNIEIFSLDTGRLPTET